MPKEIEYRVHHEELQRMLKGLRKRLGNLRPVMKVVGEIVHESIQTNFEKGGRPTKWKELKRATIKERRRIGKWLGRILVRSGTRGGLMGAISYRAFNDRVVMLAGKIYAAIHHFGGMAGWGKKVKIPARPYMMIQDEDWAEIKAALSEYIIVGAA